MTRRTLAVAGLGGILCLAALVAVWILRPKPGPVSARRVAVWETVPSTVEPLSGDPEASCTLAERVVVTKRHRIPVDEGESVAASCKYVMHLEGWPKGEDECILEYPAEIHTLDPTTFGSRLAAEYYRRRQGGIMLFSGPEPGRSFVSLDARWCGWESVVRGLRGVQ